MNTVWHDIEANRENLTGTQLAVAQSFFARPVTMGSGSKTAKRFQCGSRSSLKCKPIEISCGPDHPAKYEKFSILALVACICPGQLIATEPKSATT